MEGLVNNQWTLTICGGIISTVIGGVILHFIVNKGDIDPSTSATRITFFLFLQICIFVMLGIGYWVMGEAGLSDEKLNATVIIWGAIGTLMNLAGLLFGYEIFPNS
jgi:hypothetical protein